MPRHWIFILLPLLLAGCSIAMLKPLPDKKISDATHQPKWEYAVAGSGSPVVVFLSGYGADMDTWGKVYAQTEKLSTVFAYNRLGYGNSDKAREPQTGVVIVAGLRQLLRQRGLNPPYLLVGHSLGGLYVNLFARLYPQEIAGVVLVDSSHPAQQKMIRARQGVVQRVLMGVLNSLDSVAHSRHSEIASFDVTADQIKKAGPFPAIPLIVLSATRQPPSWLVREEVIEGLQEDQRSLAALSPQGRQVIAKNSGHFVQMDEPDPVIQAIREVVEKSRQTGQKELNLAK